MIKFLRSFLTNRRGNRLGSILPVENRVQEGSNPPGPNFDAMEKDFLEGTSTGCYNGLLFYRPRRQGSFRPEKDRLHVFVKQYLAEHGQSYFWSEELVARFRSWISIGAPPIERGQISYSKDLVG